MNLTVPGFLLPEAAYLYGQIMPHVDDDASNGWAAAHLCAVLMGPVEEISRIESTKPDGEPGWACELDPERTTDPAWLAQFNGATLTDPTDRELSVREMTQTSGSQRGGETWLRAAAQATLTGAKTVKIIQRYGGNAWTTLVITRTSETPDPAATLAAMTSSRSCPAWEVIQHIVSDAPIIDEGTRTIDAATATIDAATLADVT